MNKPKLSPYTKILLIICVLLAIMSCGGTGGPGYIIIVVTVTPIAESSSGITPVITPISFVGNGEPLKVTWSYISTSCTGGKLKDATVALTISGGQPPYKVSPDSPFSISNANNVKITVKSQDNQTFEAYVPPPTCAKDSVKDPGEGDQSPPGGVPASTPAGGTPAPTANPNHP